MKYKLIRKKIYKEVYDRHAAKSKIAKTMYYQPINDWSSNPYLKLKYYIIIELTALLSFCFCRLKANPNHVTLFGGLLGLLSIFFLSASSIKLNVIALGIFFFKNVFDYTDGFIARVQKKTSNFGQFFDEWTGDFLTLCVLISVPIYVYEKTNETLFLFILVALLFFEIINPKKKILSYSYLKKVSENYRKKVIKNFQYLTNIKIGNKNNKFKLNFVRFLSRLEYTGRTRYTDFIIFVIGVELYYQKIILTELILMFWLGIAISKFIFFFKNINKIKE